VLPLIDDWKSIDLRVVALRSGGTWNHGVVRVVFDSRRPSTPDERDLPRLDDLLVAHKSLDIKELDGLLESLSAGEIEIDGREVNLKNQNANPPLNYSYARLAREAAQQQLGIGSTGLYIQFWSGQSTVIDYAASQRIESALQGLRCPWDGYDDLFLNFANVSPQFARSTHIRIIEIIAPVAVWMTKAAIQDDNRLKVEVEVSPAISIDHVALSVIGFLERNVQERSQTSKKSKTDATHFSFEFSFAKRLVLVKALLVYHGMEVDRVELLGRARPDVNPRLVILQEEGPEAFLESLREEKDKLFENKISILFHVLGLSVGHYGKISENNPDLLAFSNSNDWVLVVECTEREPDINNHFTKLATRTKLIEARTPNIKAHSVLVTKFPRAMLSKTEKERAMKEMISVVTSDDFESLMKMALEGVSQSKVLEIIQELIPREPGGLSLLS
jgi:hypothetical protein